MSPVAKREEQDWVGELGDVRERLARLETGADAHEKASTERHGVLLAAVESLRERVEKAEERSWKVMLLVAAVAAGGGVGGAEIVKALAGGG